MHCNSKKMRIRNVCAIKCNGLVVTPRRRKVLEQCKAHLDKIVDTVKAMKEVVYAFCNEDFNKLEEYYKKTLMMNVVLMI